jgi:hypothetical protein
MTTPHERTRALVWTGGFLIEVARNEGLPLSVRQRAAEIARHFPTMQDIANMAIFRDEAGLGVELVRPSEDPSWADACRFGPLIRSTRLTWPE